MNGNFENSIHKTTWASEKEVIKTLNKEFYEAVCQLGPPDDIPLYKVRYPYGDKLKIDGVFHVVNQYGENVPIFHESIDKSTKEDLFYGPPMPMGIVVLKRIELYVEYDERVVPFGVLKPGTIFGLSTAIQPETSFDGGSFWQMSSGCRTSFLTSKISDVSAIKRVSKKIKKPLEIPRSYLDQFYFFKKINDNLDNDWYSEVIFFPRQWHQKHTIKWKEFRLFLFEKVWFDMRYWRSMYLHDLVYSRMTLNCKNIYQSLFINRLVRHFALMASGIVPGFSFINSDESMPYRALKEIMIETYQLKDLPVFVGLSHINEPNIDRIYYSLSIHTCHEFNLSPNIGTRKKAELSEIFRMLKSFKEQNQNWDKDLSGNQKEVIQALMTFNLSGYHCKTKDDDQDDDIKNSDEIIRDDKILAQLEISGSNKINAKGHFFSGILALSKQKSDQGI